MVLHGHIGPETPDKTSGRLFFLENGQKRELEEKAATFRFWYKKLRFIVEPYGVRILRQNAEKRVDQHETCDGNHSLWVGEKKPKSKRQKQ
ncbi:MAG: hypothetical protein PHU42_02740 [Patescibacteria group bacterium]|nr:hypothetical protein [Patescibacteria group bacterium]